nr:hypothetical protein [bacterium]
MNSLLRNCGIVLFSLTAAAGTARALEVELTGAETVSRCEADTYYISVGNPAWTAHTAENIVLVDTVPPDGFVFQNDSASITTPQGSLSGSGANPGISGSDLTWDLNALFGSSITLAPGDTLDIEFALEIDGEHTHRLVSLDAS